MHLEFCVEDKSGEILIAQLLPQLIPDGVTYRIHSYKGIGRIPRNLNSTGDAEKRIFLDNLPKLIRGCANTPYVTALILILDNDDRDCGRFLAELGDVHDSVAPDANVVFGLAIEECEAWLLGDREAILAAYPNADQRILNNYVQDSICGTWELLADAIEPSKSKGLREQGWPAPGVAKCNWAEKIGREMEIARNVSPSFQRFLAAVDRTTAARG